MIEGKNIVLRAVEKEDLKKVHEWKNDADFMRLDSFSPEHVISFESVEKKYKKRIEDEDERWEGYIIELKGEGPIGMASYRSRGGKSRNASIGIGIGEKKYWGKGYGTEALNLLLESLFDQLNFHRTELETLAINDCAIKCFEKCGFREEGVSKEAVYFDGKYHDIVHMAILEDEYRNRAKEQEKGK